MVKFAIRKKFQNLFNMYREEKYLAEARQRVEYKKQHRQLAVNFDSCQWFVSKVKHKLCPDSYLLTHFRRTLLS